MDIAGVKTTVERTTYRDFNKKTKVTTVTVITATTVGEGDSATTSYKRSVVKTDEAGVVIESFEDTKSAPETPEGDNPLSSSYGDDLVKLYFSYGQADNLTIDYVYTPAERDAEGNPTTTPTYEITITYKISNTTGGAKTVNVKAVLAMLESGIDVYINGVKLQEIETAQTFEIVGTVESSGGDVGGEEPAA
jgi:hypothetical protein